MIVGAEITGASSSPRVSTRMVVAYYGSYAVDEAKKTITYTTEGGAIHRWMGSFGPHRSSWYERNDAKLGPGQHTERKDCASDHFQTAQNDKPSRMQSPSVRTPESSPDDQSPGLIVNRPISALSVSLLT